MAADIAGRPLLELLDALRSGELGAVEMATACLDAIAAREHVLKAWVTIDRDAVLANARKLDAVEPADRGPLHGIPVGVKDIIDTADMPTEYGSPIYADHRPARDAEVVARLRTAGALVVGKTVTTEFALFTAGPTTNPHDRSRTPGGSSSGSAAAVGAATIPLAIGTQTAGSVVRPASFCGVFGVKPTFGRLPTTGVKPCSPTLDTVGIFARDISGAAYALQALTAAAAPRSVDREPVRVGFTRTPEWSRIPEDTRSLIERAVEQIAAELDVVEVGLPFAGLVAAQTVIMQVEARSALSAERTQHADQLSPALQEILRAGDHVVWAYQAALTHVQRCRGRLGEVFDGVDVLLAPSVLGEAPPLEQGTGDPLLCRTWTALGTPAVSVPGLTGPAGLPLGIQVIAPPGRDDLALAGAHQVGTIIAALAGE